MGLVPMAIGTTPPRHHKPPDNNRERYVSRLPLGELTYLITKKKGLSFLTKTFLKWVADGARPDDYRDHDPRHHKPPDNNRERFVSRLPLEELTYLITKKKGLSFN
jgi:hypothetical protein